MPIVIKEIIVKTTVERQMATPSFTPELLKQIKDSVMKEIERKHKKQAKWIGER